MVNSKKLDDGISYAKSLKIISIITLAERGSLIVNDDKVLEIKPRTVSKVVDTTGAGDGFVAGFAVGLTEGKSIKKAIRFANALAGLSTTKIGTAQSMPSRLEIDSLND